MITNVNDLKRLDLIFRFLDFTDEQIKNQSGDPRLINLAVMINSHVHAEQVFRYCISSGLTGKNILDKINTDHEGKWILATLNDIINMYENNNRALYADKDFGTT